jgi:glycosyltransferase involved in cell wall biosynthesis
MFSVVIPTYNQAKFLGEALQSVVDQTYPYWEAFVINNNSIDDTEAVARSFQDSRIKLINFSNQGVIAASRNLAISQSQGEFITFLDSDDTWYPQKLETCLNALTEGNDFVCHGQDHFVEGQAGKKPVVYGPVERTQYYKLLTEGNCLSTSASAVRRNILEQCGKFSLDATFNTSEDYDLWLKLARAGARIKILDSIHGSYRIHGANTSSSRYRQAKATSAVLKSHLAADHSMPLLVRLKTQMKIMRIGFYILRNNE